MYNLHNLLLYYVISKLLPKVNTFYRYFFNKYKKFVDIYASKKEEIITKLRAIKTKTIYLNTSNLTAPVPFFVIIFTKLIPETKTINIDIIYIILCKTNELQMKIMAVLTLCVANTAEIVYPIEKALFKIM